MDALVAASASSCRPRTRSAGARRSRCGAGSTNRGTGSCSSGSATPGVRMEVPERARSRAGAGTAGRQDLRDHRDAGVDDPRAGHSGARTPGREGRRVGQQEDDGRDRGRGRRAARPTRPRHWACRRSTRRVLDSPRVLAPNPDRLRPMMVGMTRRFLAVTLLPDRHGVVPRRPDRGRLDDARAGASAPRRVWPTRRADGDRGPGPRRRLVRRRCRALNPAVVNIDATTRGGSRRRRRRACRCPTAPICSAARRSAIARGRGAAPEPGSSSMPPATSSRTITSSSGADASWFG